MGLSYYCFLLLSHQLEQGLSAMTRISDSTQIVNVSLGMVKEMSVIHASYLAFTASTLLAGTQNKQLDEEEGRQPPETSLII